MTMIMMISLTHVQDPVLRGTPVHLRRERGLREGRDPPFPILQLLAQHRCVHLVFREAGRALEVDLHSPRCDGGYSPDAVAPVVLRGRGVVLRGVGEDPLL